MQKLIEGILFFSPAALALAFISINKRLTGFVLIGDVCLPGRQGYRV